MLVVRAPAEFTVLPTQQVVDPGGTAAFNVTATGSDPLNYQWSFNGALLPGEITNAFTRYNAQHADGGKYQVAVANATGSASVGAELIVRPIFTSLTPTNGSLVLNWHGTTGKVYIVEGSTNVTAPSTNWTVLGSVTNTAWQGQSSVSLTNPSARVLRLQVVRGMSAGRIPLTTHLQRVAAIARDFHPLENRDFRQSGTSALGSERFALHNGPSTIRSGRFVLRSGWSAGPKE